MSDPGTALASQTGAIDLVTNSETKTRATRLGGHPGRVVGGYLGGLELEGLDEIQRGVSLSVGDHTDLLGTLGAAIHDLLTHERRTAVALGAG
jgi:hypothetical protein